MTSLWISEVPSPITVSLASRQYLSTENALLAPWIGPYGGVPAFDKMNLDDLKPAMETAMAQTLQAIDKIAENTDPPTFENTIVAREEADEIMNQIYTFYGLWRGNISLDSLMKIGFKSSNRSSVIFFCVFPGILYK